MSPLGVSRVMVKNCSRVWGWGRGNGHHAAAQALQCTDFLCLGRRAAFGVPWGLLSPSRRPGRSCRPCPRPSCRLREGAKRMASLLSMGWSNAPGSAPRHVAACARLGATTSRVQMDCELSRVLNCLAGCVVDDGVLNASAAAISSSLGVNANKQQTIRGALAARIAARGASALRTVPMHAAPSQRSAPCS
jgi:hypothetical protein